MINYFFKEDLASALNDFQSFCKQAERIPGFAKSVGFAKKYIDEIQTKLEC